MTFEYIFCDWDEYASGSLDTDDADKELAERRADLDRKYEEIRALKFGEVS